MEIVEDGGGGPDLSSEASGGFPINAVAPPRHGASERPKSGGESQRPRLLLVERGSGGANRSFNEDAEVTSRERCGGVGLRAEFLEGRTQKTQMRGLNFPIRFKRKLRAPGSGCGTAHGALARSDSLYFYAL
nr:hypothetical protein Iba_chr09eCG4450 [Ipomoea batatas]GME13143.1 hypothetical protein Iba_scaffold14356CG0060 [Ipomoea batatas]